MPEEWGGETIVCKVSAKKNIGIDNLLENLVVLAEVLELKANPNRAGQGTVIEARLDKGRDVYKRQEPGREALPSG